MFPDNEDEVKEAQEPQEGEGQKKRYQKPERHIKRADFQRIEDAPLDKFEQQIQQKIAVVPDAGTLLIRKEEKALFEEALKHVSFTDLENKCLSMTVEGLNPTEIGNRLKIRDTAVHWHLQKAVRKIRIFLNRHYGLSWPKERRDKKS